MKRQKKEIQKLRLSRETLRALTSVDALKAIRGADFTPGTGIGCCPTREVNTCESCPC